MPRSTPENHGEPGGAIRLTATVSTMFDLAPIGVSITRGPDHRLVYVNEAQRAIFGPRPLGKPLLQAFNDLAEAGYILVLDQVMTTGKPEFLPQVPVTVNYPNAGRQERYFNLSFTPVFLDDGEPAVLNLIADVTETIDAAQRKRALQRYTSIVRSGSLVEWSASPIDGSLQWIRGWEEITGQPNEESRGHGWLNMVAPEDRAALLASWLRAIDEVPDSVEYIFRVRTRDGTYRHFRAHAVPVRENGVVVEWTGTCADVEQQWREQRRHALFNRASGAISNTALIEDMLKALPEVIVPEVADVCTVHLLSPTSSPETSANPFIVERLATKAREGITVPPPRFQSRFTIRSTYLELIRQKRSIHRVFPVGKPPLDPLSPNSSRWLRQVKANSVVMLPITVEGELVASLVAVVCGEREPLTQDDADLLADLIDHLQPTIDTFASFQRTQRVARALQHSLLSDPPTIPGLPIVGRYQTSPTSAEVGGDWYDAFIVDDTIMLVIGDVAGHDLTAATAMSQMRNMLRAFAADHPHNPHEVLRRLDGAVQRSGEYKGTATCILARVTPDSDGIWQVDYSVAGHLPPLLVLPNGETRFLEKAHDLLLGVDPTMPRHRALEVLPSGATLLLYTDGLVEHPHESLDIGLERLAHHCAAMARIPLNTFCDRLLTELPIAGNDDITLIALRLESPTLATASLARHD